MTGLRMTKVTRDPAYSLTAKAVYTKLGISRGGLYVRRDLMALARLRNGMMHWRPADIQPFVDGAQAATTFTNGR